VAQDLNKRLEVRRSQVSSVLDEDEQLLAENGAFILLTNERFIQLSALGKVKKSLLLQEVERLSTTRQPLAKAGPLIAHTSSGSKVNFGILADADWKNFQEVFAVARLAPVRAKKKPAEKDKTKEKTKEKNAKSQAPKVNPKRMEELEIVKKYGSVTAEGIFSIHKVTIYSMGYVKVGGIFGGGSIQKLLDIFGESDITKKTGLGRTATAILTGGINLALLPNQRGNVYLSVSTPSKTHSLMKELPTEHDLRLMNKLVSAGKAAISRRDTGASEVKAPAGKSTAVGVDQSLENLVKLHKDGLLDDAEYKAAKAKLLGL
jgi:hypothetical protein